jgi:hypothetical protein
MLFTTLNHGWVMMRSETPTVTFFSPKYLRLVFDSSEYVNFNVRNYAEMSGKCIVFVTSRSS